MSDRPSVLIVTGYYDPFSGYQEVNLARSLAEFADVRVIAGDLVSPIFSDATLEKLGSRRRYELSPCWDGNVEVVRVEYQKISSLLIAPMVPRVLRSGRDEYDVVLVLAVGQIFSVPAAWIPRARHRATIFGDNRAQWSSLSTRQFRMKERAFKYSKGLAYRAVAAQCDTVYVNTPNTSARLKYVAPRSTTELLPLSVDGDVFRPGEEDRSRTRREFNVPDGVPLIGVVGKASPEKRLELVIDALQSIGSGSDWRLILAGLGDDYYGMGLRRRVAESELLKERVTCLGFIETDRMVSVLRAADTCVWPVQPAITIQQAMATGTRVLLPNNDLVGHLVTDDSLGTLIVDGNYESLVQGLELELSKRPSESERTQRARRASRFTSRETALRILKDAGLNPESCNSTTLK